MFRYLVIPAVLLALFFAASGVAAVARGWVLPMYRGRVRRVRLFGWGQLMAAVAACGYTVFGVLEIGNPGVRSLGILSASGLLLAGGTVMRVSQRAGDDWQGSGTR
ncbi:hypothetical protein [Streptomyces sp. NPDC000994]